MVVVSSRTGRPVVAGQLESELGVSATAKPGQTDRLLQDVANAPGPAGGFYAKYVVGPNEGGPTPPPAAGALRDLMLDAFARGPFPAADAAARRNKEWNPKPLPIADESGHPIGAWERKRQDAADAARVSRAVDTAIQSHIGMGAGAPKTAAPASDPSSAECWCSCGGPHKGPGGLAPACKDRGDMHIAAAKARALLGLVDARIHEAREAAGGMLTTRLDSAEWSECYVALNCASWALEYASQALSKVMGGVLVGAEVKWVAPGTGKDGAE